MEIKEITSWDNPMMKHCVERIEFVANMRMYANSGRGQ